MVPRSRDPHAWKHPEYFRSLSSGPESTKHVLQRGRLIPSFIAEAILEAYLSRNPRPLPDNQPPQGRSREFRDEYADGLCQKVFCADEGGRKTL